MRFILYILILILWSFSNSNVLNALTPNKEKNSSLFGVFSYSNKSYSLASNDVEAVKLINIENDNNTFLDDSTINSIDTFSNIDLMKKEIESLNNELEKLHKKLSSLEDENHQLKLSLEKINLKEQNQAKTELLINELQKEVRKVRADNIDQNIPDQYAKAQNLLIVGNINLANKQFQDFLAKNTTSKEYDNLNNTYIQNNNEHTNNIYISYSNYWLGKISIIENNYNEAVRYFAECYRISNSNTLSLKSLVGLIESLTNLARPNDVCTAIKQFNYDYQKASEQDKEFTFPESYLKLIENYKSINRCQ